MLTFIKPWNGGVPRLSSQLGLELKVLFWLADFTSNFGSLKQCFCWTKQMVSVCWQARLRLVVPAVQSSPCCNAMVDWRRWQTVTQIHFRTTELCCWCMDSFGDRGRHSDGFWTFYFGTVPLD
jgi:hypothetical protein